jgi:hypothetical protein
MDLQIHQLLHGYRRGHQLLAGSLVLPAKSAELVKRLSDLSGLLTNNADFPPYLTAYPLVDSKFYALAKTWADHKAAREGCVLTHTLLIDKRDWVALRDPSILATYFSLPNVDFKEYEHQLTINNEMGELVKSSESTNPVTASAFVNLYFGKGLRPIIWFDESNAEICWLLLKSLWPRLREEFACCTFSLQPRRLEERPFDLLFAPSYVYSRFSKIPRDNVVEPSASLSNINTEQWMKDFATAIFFGDCASEFAKDLQEFSPLLRNEPTSIKSVFVLGDLRKRVNTSPTAAVGLMDVVASLSPDEESAKDYKRKTVDLAISSAKRVSDVEEALKCYYLISERLERTAYRSIDSDLIADLSSEVCSLTLRTPETALSTGERSFLTHRSVSSAYAAGVTSGLINLAQQSSDLLKVLHRFPSITPVIIAFEPIVTRGFLRAMKDAGEVSSATEDLVSWISSIGDHGTKNKLRLVLLPELTLDNEMPLAELLLSDLDEDQVIPVLTTISQSTDAFRSPRIRQVLCERVSDIFPKEVRHWAESIPNWTSEILQVIAASYTQDSQGLDAIIEGKFPGSARRANLICAFLQRISIDGFPAWFREYSLSNVEFLSLLLSSGPNAAPSSLSIIERALSDLRDLPIAQNQSVLSEVDRFVSSNLGPLLIDRCMQSLIRSFISATINREEYERWQEKMWAKQWFSGVTRWDLESLLSRSCTDTLSWSRAWRWLCDLHDSVVWRKDIAVPKLVESVISSRRNHWSWQEDDVLTWVSLLNRVAVQNDGSAMHLEMCAYALDYSFKHIQSPLGKIVVACFWPVYSAVLGSDHAQQSSGIIYAILSWLDLDWDKAKDLRKKLVSSFGGSVWAPGDLALAIPDTRTRRKIVKRILRQRNGEGYVARMITDLRSRQNQETDEMANYLVDLLKSPDYYERWD